MVTSIKEQPLKVRPVYRNIHVTQLASYRLPLAGWASILHRISGALMFLLLPFAIWMFDTSLTSEVSFEQFRSLFVAGTAVFALTGALLAWSYGELVEALTLQPQARLIGIGMWLALIMAFNVWFIIWPAQKKILGLVEASDEAKAKAAPLALAASRTNVLLSLPMLYALVSANLG